MKKCKKRGRPRIEGKTREPNGRISRAKKPRELVNKLALEMRAKHNKLSVQDAKNPLSGTYVGRLYLLGKEKGINKEQYNASQQYSRVRNSYLRAKGLPGAIYDTVSTNHDQDSLERWVEITTDRYNAMEKVIREAQGLYHQYDLDAALRYLVIKDEPLEYLISSLRIALNVLHEFFDREAEILY